MPNAVRLLITVFIVVTAPLATGQNSVSSSGAEQSAGCLPRASRAKKSCDPTQIVVRSENEIKFSLELPPRETAQCAVSVEVSYTQRGAAVSVEGSIENKDCGASSGEYDLVISVRDESRELKTLEFSESWQRQDDQSVKFSGVYPIGENVDLVRVRPVRLRCTCTDTPPEE